MTLSLLILTLAGGPVTAAATADRADLRLSEHATLTLTLEGDTPLRVTPPAAWLPGPGAAWRLRPLGPARVEDLSPTRQRWTLSLRADPDAPGEGPLQVTAAQVTAGAEFTPRDVPFPPVAMRVVATVALGRDRPRPPTDVEDAEEPLPSATSVSPLIAAAGVGVAVLAALAWRRRSVRTAAPDTPRGRFERELDYMRGEAVPGEQFPARLSAAVREYVEAVDGLPARRRTPREIEPLADAAGRLHDLPELLRKCDEARFSRLPVGAEARADLIATAAALVKRPA